jgi:hypothetical protein
LLTLLLNLFLKHNQVGEVHHHKLTSKAATGVDVSVCKPASGCSQHSLCNYAHSVMELKPGRFGYVSHVHCQTGTLICDLLLSLLLLLDVREGEFAKHRNHLNQLANLP